MARLLIISRSLALGMRLTDLHEVDERAADDLEQHLPQVDGFDVLVLDVGDPVLAVNTVNSLREDEQAVPVMLISGYQPEWEQVEAQQVEGVHVVPLPITRQALLRGVAILLDEDPDLITVDPTGTLPMIEMGAADNSADATVIATQPLPTGRRPGAGAAAGAARNQNPRSEDEGKVASGVPKAATAQPGSQGAAAARPTVADKAPAARSGAAKPGTPTSGASRLGAATSGAATPSVATSGAATSGAAKPGTPTSGAAKPGAVASAGAARPAAAQPSAPRAAATETSSNSKAEVSSSKVEASAGAESKAPKSPPAKPAAGSTDAGAGAAKPGAANPGAATPGTSTPGTAKPGTATPSSATSGAVKPSAAKPTDAKPADAKPAKADSAAGSSTAGSSSAKSSADGKPSGPADVAAAKAVQKAAEQKAAEQEQRTPVQLASGQPAPGPTQKNLGPSTGTLGQQITARRMGQKLGPQHDRSRRPGAARPEPEPIEVKPSPVAGLSYSTPVARPFAEQPSTGQFPLERAPQREQTPPPPPPVSPVSSPLGSRQNRWRSNPAPETGSVPMSSSNLAANRRLGRIGDRPRKLQRRADPADNTPRTPSRGLVTDPLGPRTDPYGFPVSALERRLDAEAAAAVIGRPGVDGEPVLRTADLIRALHARSGELYGVSDTAQVLADDVIERASADAAAILVPDGPVWRVSGGVGLRPLERRLELNAEHWLITEVGGAGRAVLVDDTDIVRQQLAGAPLAAWRHLMAVPVPDVRVIVVLARNEEGGAFTAPDLNAVHTPVRESAVLLAQAIETRRLARALAPLREPAPESGRPSPKG